MKTFSILIYRFPSTIMSGKVITVWINGNPTPINKLIRLNLTGDIIHIQGKVEEVSIFNASEKLVYRGTDLIISVAHFPKGLYYLIGRTEGSKRLSQKVMGK